MFKVSLSTIGVIVSLDSGNQDIPARVAYEGESIGVDIVKGALIGATGAFGHLLSQEAITPVDLHYALVSRLPDVDMEVLEGSEMIEEYGVSIPEGADS